MVRRHSDVHVGSERPRAIPLRLCSRVIPCYFRGRNRGIRRLCNIILLADSPGGGPTNEAYGKGWRSKISVEAWTRLAATKHRACVIPASTQDFRFPTRQNQSADAPDMSSPDSVTRDHPRIDPSRCSRGEPTAIRALDTRPGLTGDVRKKDSARRCAAFCELLWVLE
jgi:hypothetical protein